MGRPTDYNEEMQAKADHYAQNWAEAGDSIPSVAGLACFLGVARATMHNWAKEHPQFLGTLDSIKESQEREALNKGITGAFNATITKLVLANHGYADRVQQDNTSSDGSMSPRGLGDFYDDAKE